MVAVTDPLADRTREITTARPLSGRELFAWRAFVETVSDLQNALEIDLAPTGLTLGDYQVLVFLSEAEDQAMRMCDLASSLQLSPSGLTRRLDGLVKHGLVDRQPSVADRRVMLAVITQEGADRLAEAYPIHLASVRRRIIDQLDISDIDAFGRIFATIQASLGADREP